MIKFKLEKSEHNHYIKQTILENWLINGKYYYFDIKNNCVDSLGKNQSEKQFTSLLISQNIEKLIDTNTIENNFEKSVKSYIQHNDLISPKDISKIPSNKIEEIKNKKTDLIFNSCVDYIALQLNRNPNNTYKYFSAFKKGIEKTSNIFHIYSQDEQNLTLSMGYKSIFDTNLGAYPTLFHMIKAKIPLPHEFYFIKSERNIFHLSESNTCSLFELLEKSNLFHKDLTESMLKHTYISVLSPSLLFLVNCNKEKFTDEIMQPIVNNIEYLWTHFVINDTLGKIILPNQEGITLQNLQNIINNKEIKLNSLYETFILNESIYKNYLLKK